MLKYLSMRQKVIGINNNICLNIICIIKTETDY